MQIMPSTSKRLSVKLSYATNVSGLSQMMSSLAVLADDAGAFIASCGDRTYVQISD